MARGPLRSRYDIHSLMDAINFEVPFDATKGAISDGEFMKWHEENTKKICHRLGVGWSTKLINVYLKTRVYLAREGRPNLQEVIHPPIDNYLWRGIKKNFGDQPQIISLTHKVQRIKDIKSYDTYSQIISGCRLVAKQLKCTLIEVDQLWCP